MQEPVILDYTSHRNDLFASFKCECPSKLFEGTDIAHLMKETVSLSGYNDDYFFDVVNKEPQILSCRCGRKFQVQWRREGVEVTRFEEADNAQ